MLVSASKKVKNDNPFRPGNFGKNEKFWCFSLTNSIIFD